IEHRQFLSDTHRIAVRNDRTEQRDFDRMDARRNIGGCNRWGRGQDARRIVVFRQADPIEPEFFCECDPLNHPSINAHALAGVICGGGHRPNCWRVRWRPIAASFKIRDFHEGPLHRPYDWQVSAVAERALISCPSTVVSACTFHSVYHWPSSGSTCEPRTRRPGRAPVGWPSRMTISPETSVAT